MDPGTESVSGMESLVRDQVDALASHSTALQALPDNEQQAITEATATVLRFLGGPPVGTVSSAAADITREVDFPGFVRGLIVGVFEATVNASIKQMQAYGDLIKGVVGEVDRISRAPAVAAEDRTSDWNGVTSEDRQRVAEVLAAGIRGIATDDCGTGNCP